VESTFRLVDRALGAPAESMRLLMLDAVGRFRLVAERRGSEDAGRKRSARRREAVVTKQTKVILLRRPPGSRLAIVPVVYRGESVGVLEVASTGPLTGELVVVLEAIGDQIAIVLRHIRLIEEGRRIVEASARIAQLMHALLGASSREHALRIVVRFLWGALDRPVAGWLGDPDEGSRLVATRGVGRELRARLTPSADWPWDAEAIARWASDVLEGSTPIVTSAGDAVVAVGGAWEGAAGLFRAVESGLSITLDRLTLRRVVQELPGSVDAGLAWTAHEIRGPLLGAEKAIDAVTTRGELGDLDELLLKRARTDLRALAATVDDLLRWSVGAATVRRRRTDLTRLVTETMRSLPFDESGRRISTHLPEKAVVRGDPLLLRVAISNLVRNSLQHGEGEVEVTLEMTDEDATVSVSDQGPGVHHDELPAVFEPFVRGRRAAHGGQGLGLFIARRAVQAHGGALWFEAGGGGPVFHMRIPAGAA
jgi:signal transduction histidine kinase